MESLSSQVGLAFIGGYGGGFAAGAIVGLARNIDELPLIRLNQTLNTANYYGERVGYTVAMGIVVFQGTKMVTEKVAQGIHPIAESALAGGVTGAVLCSKGGWKRTVQGGAVGTCVGAAIGALLNRKSD